jgi:hypothetical protein
MKEGSFTTVSVSRKVNLGNYESEDVFVSITVTPEMTVRDMEQLLAANEAAYELVKGEVERRVFGIKNPGKPDLFQPTVDRLSGVLSFTEAQIDEFNSICENREVDPVTTFLCAWEQGCISYDQFAVYAATGKKPDNAKPRLEVAQ